MWGAKAPFQLEPQLDVPVEFRTVAIIYSVTFFVTLALAGVVTFNATAYAPDTDKIELYYGMFNPCIWFDHYPAKALAMTGIGLFLLIGNVYSILIYVWVYLADGFFKVIWGGFLIAVITVVAFTFVNVFTTNLYPGEDPEQWKTMAAVQSFVRGRERRLHGLNGTVALFEEQRDEILTPEAIQTIILHTAFYIVWLLSETCFSIYCLSLIWQRTASWGIERKIRTTVLWIIGLYGMVMHSCAMLVIILQDEPKVDWYFKEDLQNSIQHGLIWLDAKTLTSVWGWIPVMFYRYVMPRGTGINLHFSLNKGTNGTGGTYPELFVGRCVRLVTLLLAGGGIFHHAWEESGQNVFNLAMSLREKPYAYISAPAYLAASAMMALGVFLTVVQRQLMQDNQPPMLLMFTGMGLFFSMYGCVLSILEQFRFSCAFFLGANVFYILWVAQLSWNALHVAIPYILVGIWTNWICYTDGSWYWYYLYLIWLSLYDLIVPDGACLYMTATRIGEVEDKANEWNKVAQF